MVSGEWIVRECETASDLLFVFNFCNFIEIRKNLLSFGFVNAADGETDVY